MKYELMNIYDGFIRNYDRLEITKSTNQKEKTKKELSYFISLGKILGLSVTMKNNKKIDNIDFIQVIWRRYYESTNISDKEEFNLIKVEDNFRDELAADVIINYMKEANKANWNLLMIDIISLERINYINKIVSRANILENKELLVVYKFNNIKENTVENYAYRFEGNKLIEDKVISVKENMNGILSIIK